MFNHDQEEQITRFQSAELLLEPNVLDFGLRRDSQLPRVYSPQQDKS
jgi:hypothetical protein